MVRSAWLRRISTFAVTATMAAFGFTSVASAQTTNTITNTGNGSTNTITNTDTNTCTVRNTNNVHVTNLNNQNASSGDVTSDGNTSTGLSWTGWSSLDPLAAQAQGLSYNAWNGQVTSWISARAGGAGWVSTNDNTSWTPGSSSWSAYDPVVWQANGQTFGNWYNSVESYLDAGSTAWVLGWPAEDTGTGTLGTSSGNASNYNSSNFTIRINNAASTAAGTNACGQSNFTVPPVTGGMGGGGSVSSPAVLGSSTSRLGGGSGSGGSGGFVGGSGGFFAPASHPSSSAPASSPASSGTTTPVVCPPSTPAAPSNVNTISNTGKDSTNTITNTTTNTSTVTNTNNVSAVNINNQTASSGNTTSTDNTTAGGAGTGNATNTNGTGVDGTINN